jgi:alkylation response protein AidB-like acyl-CoA dehydrogenase
MEFTWSAEQIELFNSIERFAFAELNDGVSQRDKLGEFSRSEWKKCGEIGIHGLPLAKEYGGRGCDALTTAAALERLGYACKDNGLVFSINAHMWTAMMPLSSFGSEEQRRRYLPGLASGRIIGGNGTSEPDTGSDAYGMKATAEKRAGRYIINGRKMFVTNGTVADVLIVYAKTDPTKGPLGISAFLIEKGTPGMSILRSVEKMGIRTSPMAEIQFENCEVPESARLGNEGNGQALFTHSMVWERGCILSSAIGAMQRLLEKCVRHAKKRTAFGQPIGKFQQVSTKLVDMKLRVETARRMLYYHAWLIANGKSCVMESAMNKLYISESWIQCCEHAMQIHGGYGYLVENEIEREMRDSLASRLYSGTNEVQRNLIAAMLGV